MVYKINNEWFSTKQEIRQRVDDIRRKYGYSGPTMQQLTGEDYEFMFEVLSYGHETRLHQRVPLYFWHDLEEFKCYGFKAILPDSKREEGFKWEIYYMYIDLCIKNIPKYHADIKTYLSVRQTNKNLSFLDIIAANKPS